MITQTRLKELLTYDPETGSFVWRVTVNYNATVGSTAGCVNEGGYVVIGISRKWYGAHRLAFLYMTGSLPIEVDHINHVKDDNSWSNLRPVDHATNHRNQSLRKDNTSGIVGVYPLAKTGKWRAEITVNGKKVNLGRFDDLTVAGEARAAAEKKYNFHPNHGAPS